MPGTRNGMQLSAHIGVDEEGGNKGGRQQLRPDTRITKSVRYHEVTPLVLLGHHLTVRRLFITT